MPPARKSSSATATARRRRVFFTASVSVSLARAEDEAEEKTFRVSRDLFGFEEKMPSTARFPLLAPQVTLQRPEDAMTNVTTGQLPTGTKPPAGKGTCGPTIPNHTLDGLLRIATITEHGKFI